MTTTGAVRIRIGQFTAGFGALVLLGCLAFEAAAAIIPAPFTRRAVCARSQAYTDRFGYVWSADQAWNGDWGYFNSGAGITLDQYYVENTHDVPLYQAERLSPKYRFTVPAAGTYYVKLLLAENYWGWDASRGGGEGTRVFDVMINGQKVLDRFDILAATHGRAPRALIRAFAVQVPAGGPYQIEITTASYADLAKFNAIEVSSQPTLTDTIGDESGYYDAGAAETGEAFRINCGGAQSRDADATFWMADEPLSLCERWGYQNGTPKVADHAPWSLPAAYRLDTWREGGTDLAYTVFLPNGSYRVRLLFQENEHTAAGQRVFDVAVNGTRAASGLDVFARVGYRQPYALELDVTVTQERLDITFPTVAAGAAMLNALEARVVNVGIDPFLNFIQRRNLEYFTTTSGAFRTVEPSNGLVVEHLDNFAPATLPTAGIGTLGFGLAALCAAADRGWLTQTEVQQRLLTTLRFLDAAQPYTSDAQPGLTHHQGFFFHYLDMATGKRSFFPGADGRNTNELSPMDTALLFAGLRVVARCYPGGELAQLADRIYQRADWNWLVNGNTQGYLANAWSPEAGFSPYQWSGYNEDILMYLLAMGDPVRPLPPKGWFNLTREWYDANGTLPVQMIERANEPTPLFTHLYPQGFISLWGHHDDKCDYGWNTQQAIRANEAYCLQRPGTRFDAANTQRRYTYARGGWSLTASDAPKNSLSYFAYRSLDWNHDGTVSPSMAGASLPYYFSPSYDPLRKAFFQHKHFLWGRYGFANSYNLAAPRCLDMESSGQGWVSPRVIGIDHGAMFMGIENLQRSFFWNKLKEDPVFAAGLARVNWGSERIDDFQNDQHPGDAPDQRDAQWWSSNNAVYSLATVGDVAGNPGTCLRVSYQKPSGEEWSFIAAGNLSWPANLSFFSSASRVSLHVLGGASLLMKFRDKFGRESSDAGIRVSGQPSIWQALTWDLGTVNWGTCDPKQIQDLLLFVEPGQTGSGAVYLDNFKLGDPDPVPVAPTPTPTPTALRSATPTASRTATITPTRFGTPEPTPTVTPTPTASATQTPWIPTSNQEVLFTSGNDIWGIYTDGTRCYMKTFLPPSVLYHQAAGANNSRSGGRVVMTGSITLNFGLHPEPTYAVWVDYYGPMILSTSFVYLDKYENPRWSWGGDKLALNRAGNILTCNPDGSGLATVSPGYDDSPCWTADDRIVYAHAENWGQTRSIFLMNADGGDRRLIFGGGNCVPSDCAPDHILFSSDRTGVNQVYRINFDGTGLTQLTQDGDNRQARYNGDFSQIVFCSRRNGTAAVYLMDPDGSGQTALIDSESADEVNPFFNMHQNYVPTRTPTPTGTETATPSSTVTPTLIITPIPPTATGSRTPQPTGTTTRTVTHTGSPTHTVTWTVSMTATPTRTVTPTLTRTRTNTRTRTATRTITRTVTPTLTRTRTATRTITRTRTVTRTMTPTRTCTRTFTATRTPTRTVTATATRTPRYTRTRTRTITQTPVSGTALNGTDGNADGVLAFTATPSSSPTFTVTATFTPGQDPSRTPTFTPTLRVELPDGQDAIAYPNPARGTVTFAWEERHVDRVRVLIFSMNGERVAQIEAGPQDGNRVNWAAGRTAPGVYLYQVRMTVKGRETVTKVRKLAIVK